MGLEASSAKTTGDCCAALLNLTISAVLLSPAAAAALRGPTLSQPSQFFSASLLSLLLTPPLAPSYSCPA